MKSNGYKNKVFVLSDGSTLRSYRSRCVTYCFCDRSNCKPIKRITFTGSGFDESSAMICKTCTHREECYSHFDKIKEEYGA